MIKINQPTPSSPTPRPHNRTTAVEATVPTNKDKQDLPVDIPFVERRKSSSDRRSHRDARGPFDMRSGRRDRRRNSGPHPSIEEDV